MKWKGAGPSRALVKPRQVSDFEAPHPWIRPPTMRFSWYQGSMDFSNLCHWQQCNSNIWRIQFKAQIYVCVSCELVLRVGVGVVDFSD